MMGSAGTDVTLSRRRFWHKPGPEMSVRKRRRFFNAERPLVAAITAVVLMSTVTIAAVLTVMHVTQWFYVVPAVLALAVMWGRFLGDRVWPHLGVLFASVVLRFYARMGRRRGARLLLTPFADFMPGSIRQTWESTAFASGTAVMVGASLLFLSQGRPSALVWFSMGVLAFSCALTFLLVPHWTFARLGLRLSEPDRFVVRSVADSYDRIVRVSNGTILIFAAFYGVGILADRATRVEWYFTMLVTIVGMLGLAVVVTGTAAAYFKRHEEEVVKRVANEARRVGFMPVRMGRM